MSYLNSNGPGSMLVTPHLDGNNFHSWSKSMKFALGSKATCFVDASLPKLDEADFLYPL